MYKIVCSPAFKKEYRRLVKKNPRLRQKIQQRIRFFLQNPSHPSLRIHKVFSPKVGLVFSLSVDRDIRILFRWEKKTVVLYRIGRHQEVY